MQLDSVVAIKCTIMAVDIMIIINANVSLLKLILVFLRNIKKMIIEVKICFYDLQYKLLTNLGNYIACVLKRHN